MPTEDAAVIDICHLRTHNVNFTMSSKSSKDISAKNCDSKSASTVDINETCVGICG